MIPTPHEGRDGRRPTTAVPEAGRHTNREERLARREPRVAGGSLPGAFEPVGEVPEVAHRGPFVAGVMPG